MTTAALYGDSQAQGLEPHLAALLADLGIELVHADARPGWTTERFIEEALPRSAGPSPATPVDVAIVVLGGNDTALPRYPEVLRRAVNAFRARAVRVLWVGPSYATNRVVEERHTKVRLVQAQVIPRVELDAGAQQPAGLFRALARIGLARRGVTWWDPANWQRGEAAVLRSDGTHFRRDAYALQAYEVAGLAADLTKERTALAVGAFALLTAGGTALAMTGVQSRGRRRW